MCPAACFYGSPRKFLKVLDIDGDKTGQTIEAHRKIVPAAEHFLQGDYSFMHMPEMRRK